MSTISAGHALQVTLVLPQGMAYALLVGVYPRYGLYSAITRATIVLVIVFRFVVRRFRLPQFDMLLVLVLTGSRPGRLRPRESAGRFGKYGLSGLLPRRRTVLRAAPDLGSAFTRIEQQARHRGAYHVVQRVKRVCNPDVVSLELFEHFPEKSRADGITVWLPDALGLFERLGFADWLPGQHLFPHAADEDSTTLAAIRHIRSILSGQKAKAEDRPCHLL